MLYATWEYQFTLSRLIFFGATYDTAFVSTYKSDLWARVQVYSLSLIFKLWHEPHYRSPSFQQDMKDNLRNVAIPGTGVPLSIFCVHKSVAMYFVFFILPFVCFCGAVNEAYQDCREKSWGEYFDVMSGYFLDNLLHPDDWFSFWRLNCRLVSLHSSVTGSKQYQLEDKWSFLMEGDKVGVPVSPFMKDVDVMIAKHKSIEGGMGIHFFPNAATGGDWILQKKIHNARWLSNLLPPTAPLSTMRVITFSTWSLSHTAPPVFPTTATDADASKYVEALSAVFRLGRAGAATDHSSVMFDVDIKSGHVRKGVSNAHWYKLGPSAPFSCPWLPSEQNVDQHPDPPNSTITGYKIPGMAEAVETVVRSHFKLLAEVPIVGWDVCFTPEGVCFLEVNLSCNFFKGKFDIPSYLAHVEQYFKVLERRKERPRHEE